MNDSPDNPTPPAPDPTPPAIAQPASAGPAAPMLPRLLPPPPPPLLLTGSPHVSPALLPRYSPTETPPATKWLLFYWCLGLLVTWFVALDQDGPTGASRWTLFSCLAAYCLVFPALRLSQDRVSLMFRPGQRVPGDPLAQLRMPSRLYPDSPSATLAIAGPVTPNLLFVDWFHLVLIAQVVLWPLHYQRGWSMPHTLTIDAALAVWSLLSTGFCALGVQSGTTRSRLLAMLACIALLFGEPLLMALVNQPGSDGTLWDMRLSPIELFWRLSRDTNQVDLSQAFRPLATAGTLAAAVWLLTLRSPRAKN